ncbi:MAG: hypothetical protein KKI08_25805 [Armatimonadetes bacterium]|nr:hypothetical protein [Armatimonadota bacterium]
METPEQSGPAIGWGVLQSNLAVLQPGDIVHMRWEGFPWNLVRACTRSKGEPRTWANHSAIIVGNDPVPLLVEALQRAHVRQPRAYEPTEKEKRRKRKRPRYGLVIHRHPDGLAPETARQIAIKALDYQGRIFGVGKVLLHLLDYYLGGAYLFRWLARKDDYPICSWIVAYAYYRLIGLRFRGVPPNAASPDDIMDHCVDDRWKLVWVDSPETLAGFYEFYPDARPRPDATPQPRSSISTTVFPSIASSAAKPTRWP